MLASPYSYYPGKVGLGASPVVPQSVSSIATTVGAGIATTTSILGALGAVSATVPIVGTAVAGAIGVGLAIANLFKGCGDTCTETTAIVNQAEPLFRQNLQNYLAVPNGQRSKSLQAAYLNNFKTLWNGLVQACGNPAYGQAGVNCITDRGQGDCQYKTSPGGWQQDSTGNWNYVAPGANGSGNTCWNWWVGYYDPIANDPAVIPDSSILGAAGTSAIGASFLPNGLNNSSFPIIPLLIAGIGLFFLTRED